MRPPATDPEATPLRRTPPRRPGGRTADITSRLYAATLELLEEDGLRAVTFAAVGARAGVHRGTLYRRWPGPEFLLLEALVEGIRASIPIPDTGALASDLAGALGSLARFLGSDPGRAALHALTRVERDAGVRALLRRLWSERFSEIGAMFDRAVARGELAPDFDREACFSAAAGSVYFRVIVLGEAPDARWIERVVSVLVR